MLFRLTSCYVGRAEWSIFEKVQVGTRLSIVKPRTTMGRDNMRQEGVVTFSGAQKRDNFYDETNPRSD